MHNYICCIYSCTANKKSYRHCLCGDGTNTRGRNRSRLYCKRRSGAKRRKLQKWYGANFSISIGALEIDVSPDSQPSIQLDDTPDQPSPLILRKIDNISVNWDDPTGEFVWAYISFPALDQDWLDTCQTLAATDVVGEDWKIRYEL